MPQLQFMQWAAAVTGLLFIFAFGCICGSFINVVVYRLPRGMNLVLPPSACPSCGTRLTWRENFPVFGWLLLRGRCRFCRSPISPEYPLVEAFVGVMFAALYVMWFMDPGPDLPRDWVPRWAAANGLSRAWPMLLLLFALVGSLTAATLIDIKTFTIPLWVCLFMTLTGLVIHPAHALWISRTRTGDLRVSSHPWTIPTFSGPWLAAVLAGGVGVLLSAILLERRILPRSFADYEAWEVGAQAREKAAAEAGAASGAPPAPSTPDELRAVVRRTFYLTGPAVALMCLGFTIGLQLDSPMVGMAIGTVIGLAVGIVLRNRVAASADSASGGDPLWAQYPHARREMFKELLFLAPAVIFAAGAFRIVDSGVLTAALLFDPPLWLRALGGSVAGILAGGGVVWAVRILGSLAFGKEAMGLGDVHLMAGVGAVLGWVDPLIAFFVAPFLGIAWTLLSLVFARFFRREGAALPYGPHLAAATLLVVYCRPFFEWLLSRVSGAAVNLP